MAQDLNQLRKEQIARTLATKTMAAKPGPVVGDMPAYHPMAPKPAQGTFDKNSVVPVQRPMPSSPFRPQPMAARGPWPAMPPDINSAGVVPVDRQRAYEAERAAMPQAAQPAGLPPQSREQALDLIMANKNNPAALQQMATVGGAVIGDRYGDARRVQAMARAAPALADQRALQEVVSDKALPFLNQRRPGLLGY